MNCTMPELKECFQAAGFDDVRTVLATGNVAFDARVRGGSKLSALERKVEQAMLTSLGRTFPTLIRSSEYLQALVASKPFGEFALPSTAKCVVTFLRRADERRVELPIERDGVRLLKQVGTEVFTAYEPNPNGPAFMALLERTFGKEITTRTLGTVEKCAAA